MTLQMRRDPFARTELIRHPFAYNPRGECTWCGARRGTLFTYTRRHDGGRCEPLKGAFCNADCLDAYHGERVA